MHLFGQLAAASDKNRGTKKRRQHLFRCLSNTLLLTIISYGLLGQIMLHRKLLIRSPNDEETGGDSSSSIVMDEWEGNTNYGDTITYADNEDDGVDHDGPWWLGSTYNETFDASLKPDFDNRTAVVQAAKHNVKQRWPFVDRPQDAKLYFIHVGKAGGKSLYKEIRLFPVLDALPCRMKTTYNNSKCLRTSLRTMPRIARGLLGHVHVHSPRYSEEQQEWLRNETNLLLFTVRDPVDRIVSAFNFHHNDFFKGKAPKPRHNYSEYSMGATIFLDCFQQVEDLASAVMINPPDKQQSPTALCRSIAFALLEGKARREPCPHFRWNYQFYANQVWYNRSKSVAVLRTENQWNDLANLESLLGGQPKRFFEKKKQGKKFTHGSETFALRSGVSAQGAAALCCVLHKDVQVYHDLILAAVNLKYRGKVNTLRALLEHCGVDQDLSSTEVLAWKWKPWYDDRCKSIVKSG